MNSNEWHKPQTRFSGGNKRESVESFHDCFKNVWLNKVKKVSLPQKFAEHVHYKSLRRL